jgi:hypothetical protein
MIAFVSEAGASCYQRSALNGRPRLLCEAPIEPQAGEPPQDALNAGVVDSIRAVCNKVAARSKSARIDLVLSWSLAPGCVVDLGDGTLPNRVRSELATRRVLEQFSLEAASWRVRLQSDRIAGPSLAFAVRTALADAMPHLIRAGRVKIAAVVPALVWVLNQHGREFDDGWLAIQDEQRWIVAEFRSGLCRSIDAAAGATQGGDGGASLSEAVRRIAWIRGCDEPHHPIRMIRLAAPFDLKTELLPQ